MADLVPQGILMNSVSMYFTFASGAMNIKLEAPLGATNCLFDPNVI